MSNMQYQYQYGDAIFDWFDSNWLQRIPLTINPGQVISAQTNFTLLIKNTFIDLTGEVEAEIRFAGTDGMQLDYYIQEFDNSDGTLIARILKPTVADGDIIYIYFDNPAATDEQDAVAVWTGMDFVYPLDNGNTVESLVGVDSTGTGTLQVDGKIFKAVNFVNNGDFISFTSTDWTSQTNDSTCSIAFWYKSTDANRGIFFGNFTVGSNAEFNLELFNSAIRVFITDENGFNTSMTTPVDAKFIDGEFHLFVFTYDGTERIPRLFFDGAEELSTAARPDDSSVFFDPTITFFAARDSRTTVNYVGDLELLRKFNGTQLDNDEIAIMYNNENDNAAFYSINPTQHL